MTEKTPPPLTAEEENSYVDFIDAYNSFIAESTDELLDSGNLLNYSEDDIAEEIELLGTYI
jgi:hypothetical protein